MKTILVVDDDKEITHLISMYLKNEGYEVLQSQNGHEALTLLEEKDVDLIVLDIMMPEIDGLEVCRRVRGERYLPILMLSAKTEDMDKILGLMNGADDYMIKPFNPMELSARINSLLRRSLQYNHEMNSSAGHQIIQIHSLVIDKTSYTVNIHDEPLSLTSKEFDILHLLASSPGRVFRAEEIFQLIWKEDYYAANNTVNVHIYNLREKLERRLGYKLIQTVWGVGYKIER